jgi:hypothetical protein
MNSINTTRASRKPNSQAISRTRCQTTSRTSMPAATSTTTFRRRARREALPWQPENRSAWSGNIRFNKTIVFPNIESQPERKMAILINLVQPRMFSACSQILWFHSHVIWFLGHPYSSLNSVSKPRMLSVRADYVLSSLHLAYNFLQT